MGACQTKLDQGVVVCASAHPARQSALPCTLLLTSPSFSDAKRTIATAVYGNAGRTAPLEWIDLTLGAGNGVSIKSLEDLQAAATVCRATRSQGTQRPVVSISVVLHDPTSSRCYIVGPPAHGEIQVERAAVQPAEEGSEHKASTSSPLPVAVVSHRAPTASFQSMLNLQVVGAKGCGKTALVLRFRDDTYHESTTSTLGVDVHTRTLSFGFDTTKLSIWDHGGDTRYRAHTLRSLGNAGGILVAYDVTDHDSFTQAQKWVVRVGRHLRRHRSPTKPPAVVVLVGTKADGPGEELPKHRAKRQVTVTEAGEWAKQKGLPYFETSARSGTGVTDVVHWVAQTMLQKAAGEAARQQAIIQATTQSAMLSAAAPTIVSADAKAASKKSPSSSAPSSPVPTAGTPGKPAPGCLHRIGTMLWGES